MVRINLQILKLGIATSLLFSGSTFSQSGEFGWHAGDHHIHSRYSVGWDRETDPPTAILAGDAIYPIHMNALMAKYFGLSWSVATDHGGPGHSRINFEQAYPELLQSRLVVPEVVQFYGMEFDTPAADHSSLIIPFTDDEAINLRTIESAFAKREPWPADDSWDTEPRMLEALTAMSELSSAPLLIANHPSRSASDIGVYGQDTPNELRNWNDTAPSIAVGMAGSPGHQASALNPDGTLDELASRGGYRRSPTLGGFDQLTALLGGFWDSMIGEGRNWWITSNSDSHIHYSEGGSDFWPGEYSKTYVWSKKNHASIMNGIRSGNIFVTTGDLIDELYVDIKDNNGQLNASIGDLAMIQNGKDLEITVRFRDPQKPNNNGDNPSVKRVDVIMGQITGPSANRSNDHNPTTKVIGRFSEAQWVRYGTYREFTLKLPEITSDTYFRIRGTNTSEEEPIADPKGEDPWTDLWFYSNPIRLRLNQ